MKRKLERIRELDGEVVKRLASSSLSVVTVEELLQQSVVQLVQQGGLYEGEAKKLLEETSRQICPPLVRLDEALRRGVKQLKSLLEPLDRHLGGGLPARSVTEVVGAAGVGKTQFCHQMSIQAAMGGGGGGGGGTVIYIDTEGSFSADRLVEMACHRFPNYFNTTERAEQLCSSVVVLNPRSSKELNDALQGMERLIFQQEQQPVQLVVLDSVASVVRREFGSGNIQERQAMLLEQAQMLKQLAERFDIPVIVTNQVTAATAAALGPLWHHAVNTRLVLEAERRLWVAKSPVCSVAHLEYDITTQGLVSCSLEMVVDKNYFSSSH